ncbi:MAG: tRNA uridine-5-carboxymethylaminomethyl(34) synthesis GTPase MnmE [Verrucomicrobiota bacterium]|nr:tRNA uridine-5-carboxymethylaminomethyl(34) synthesis GTPase MnmE [Verrucomicrobiota bacterium]
MILKIIAENAGGTEPMFSDTIAAISTPLGEGGLAVVRLSGPASFKVADSCFKPLGKNSTSAGKAASHTIQYGKILLNGEVVDEVLLSVFRAPRTFTKENMVEVSCHGGVLPAQMVLDALLRGGARLAEPGEFTRRAFLNGRIDLAQAEAVADLIHSRTELALRAANEQLAGKLSCRIDALRSDLMLVLAHVEAHIDFPDEDIAPDTFDQLLSKLRKASEYIEQLLSTAREGRILRRGLRTAIIGRPNAGKSSLLNQLLGQDRAIVSPIAGTTRDTIEETANVRGIPIVFVDTAGLRESKDEIEAEGIRRSREAASQAELILHVVDASQAVHEEDQNLIAEFGSQNSILIWNKSDLIDRTADTEPRVQGIPVSCVTGEGIELLKDQIKNLVWSGNIGSEMLEATINSRHQDALQRANSSLKLTISALEENQTLELAAMDLRLAVQAIGEVVGKTTTEDLLDAIFSQFCLGK